MMRGVSELWSESDAGALRRPSGRLVRGRGVRHPLNTIPPTPTLPMTAARVHGMLGVDTNADHLAAWHLDPHGNPIGAPLRFGYDLSGTTAPRSLAER